MSSGLQNFVANWLVRCFGKEVAQDKMERNYRFLEEALELVQACGMTKEDARSLVAYTYSREPGVKHQEVGGTMITLAALCHVQGIDMIGEGWREAERIDQGDVIEHIRKKNAAKPMQGLHRSLPGIIDFHHDEGTFGGDLDEYSPGGRSE